VAGVVGNGFTGEIAAGIDSGNSVRNGVDLFAMSRVAAEHDYAVSVRRQRITDGERSNIIRGGETPFAMSYRDRRKNVAIAQQCICSVLRYVRDDMLDAVSGIGRENPGLLFTERGADGFYRSGFAAEDASSFADWFSATVYGAGKSGGNVYAKKLAAIKRYGNVIYESVRGISGMPDAEAKRGRKELLRDGAAERECGRIVRKAVDEVFSVTHMPENRIAVLKPAMLSALRDISGIKYLGRENDGREQIPGRHSGNVMGR